MLTRPGSNPGPEWMRRLGSSPDGFRQIRKAILRIIILFAIIQVTATVIFDLAVYRAHSRHVRFYNSPIQIAGMPLLSVGPTARGIIAYGDIATGVVTIGGLSAGVIAFGGLSVGIFAFGGLSLAGIAVAAVAIGWRAIGAVAIGDAAVGALTIGRYAYGAVAFGYHEASGKQKESLFG
jgi:hypothetical protein